MKVGTPLRWRTGQQPMAICCPANGVARLLKGSTSKKARLACTRSRELAPLNEHRNFSRQKTGKSRETISVRPECTRRKCLNLRTSISRNRRNRDATNMPTQFLTPSSSYRSHSCMMIHFWAAILTGLNQLTSSSVSRETPTVVWGRLTSPRSVAPPDITWGIVDTSLDRIPMATKPSD